MTEAEFKGLDVKLRRYFEWKGCGSPEDLAQDTILRGLKRLAEGQTNYAENPHSYFLGIARNVLREERKKPRTEVALEESSADGGNQLNAVHWRILLRECLDQLDRKERDLIVRYTLDGAERAAHHCGLTKNALRIRVSRIRDRSAVWLKGPADLG
jgi:DNA-directed RNA polymerase specialized sigma24 family protein